jgi:hypothetical protein
MTPLGGTIHRAWMSGDKESLMNSSLEIHDSTLSGIDYVGADIVVRLAPAYIHRSEGPPGIDRGSGWLQDIDLVVHAGVVECSPSQMPCWLADGSLTIGDTNWNNCVPIPLAASGVVTLSAITENSERLVIRGTGVKSVSRRELRYVEECP